MDIEAFMSFATNLGQRKGKNTGKNICKVFLATEASHNSESSGEEELRNKRIQVCFAKTFGHFSRSAHD